MIHDYALVTPAVPASQLSSIGRYMLPLMLRNVASDGFRFADPLSAGQFSSPGCIVASPSYTLNEVGVTQNYVFNWTRDAAITAIELAFANEPIGDAVGSGPLIDYVTFAAACQASAGTLAQACFTIEARPRTGWVQQNDGPALQTLAVLACFSQLDAATQDLARTVVDADVAFILDQHQAPNFNLWEEVLGQSLFTRSVQLRCLLEVRANTVGITVPAGIDDAIGWLRGALGQHWNGEYYVSVLDSPNLRPGYDPNIDVVMSCVYGAIDPTDPQLLATAAQLRQQWSDTTSPLTYPINIDDQGRRLGPMLGRYPGDVYDGDNDNSGQDHPWALCTANFAELYYRLAATILASGEVGYTAQTAQFFAQAGITDATSPAQAAQLLQSAGDSMLQAIIFHSDHLELSEQFDGRTGYEKSVRNLSWSYAAFLSATRARAAIPS